MCTQLWRVYLPCVRACKKLSACIAHPPQSKKSGWEAFTSHPTSYSSSASIASAITCQHSAPIPEMRISRSSSLRNGRASWMRYPSLCHWESPTIVALNNSSGTVTVWLAPQMTHSLLLVIVADIAFPSAVGIGPTAVVEKNTT